MLFYPRLLVYRQIMKDRTVMTLCIQVSMFLHWWLFLSLNTYAHVKQLTTEKTALLKSMAYARRIGIDVSTYQSALKAPPFQPRFEHQLEFARLIHTQLNQMLKRLNKEIALGNYLKGAANNDAVLIVDSGDEDVISHALLVHPNGRVECQVDTGNTIQPISGHIIATVTSDGRWHKILTLPRSQAHALFGLLSDPNNLESLPADRNAPQQAQMLYVDYKGHSTPNLLCADTPDGQDLAACCKKIQAELKITEIAHLN